MKSRLNLQAVLSVLFILGVTGARFYATANTAENGKTLLLPVSVVESGRDGFSSYVRVRYDSLIPVSRLTDLSGTVVVERYGNGMARPVPDAAGRPLRPREMPLKYTIVPAVGKKTEAELRYAAAFMRCSGKKTKVQNVRYAVVRVNETGDAVLVGLADAGGVIVADGLNATARSND